MIECHLYFEDDDGAGCKIEPEDPSRQALILTAYDGSVRIGHEEAAHMILHLAAFIAGFEVQNDDD